VPFFAGMFQKEVAARVCAPPGSKVYGILSVLLQRLYEVEYLFTVPPGAFNPPPQVQSGVMRMRYRTDVMPLEHPKAFKMLVKQAFNQRRKTLRNALKGLTFEADAPIAHLLDKRAEQLHYTDFELLTKSLKR
jgi:16S rRNA (adenine1518-N6/adenine1519-N6)-dimethyltransferase